MTSYERISTAFSTRLRESSPAPQLDGIVSLYMILCDGAFVGAGINLHGGSHLENVNDVTRVYVCVWMDTIVKST